MNAIRGLISPDHGGKARPSEGLESDPTRSNHPMKRMNVGGQKSGGRMKRGEVMSSKKQNGTRTRKRQERGRGRGGAGIGSDKRQPSDRAK